MWPLVPILQPITWLGDLHHDLVINLQLQHVVLGCISVFLVVFLRHQGGSVGGFQAVSSRARVVSSRQSAGRSDRIVRSAALLRFSVCCVLLKAKVLFIWVGPLFM